MTVYVYECVSVWARKSLSVRSCLMHDVYWTIVGTHVCVCVCVFVCVSVSACVCLSVSACVTHVHSCGVRRREREGRRRLGRAGAGGDDGGVRSRGARAAGR